VGIDAYPILYIWLPACDLRGSGIFHVHAFSGRMVELTSQRYNLRRRHLRYHWCQHLQG
jgi:hypothetical protein